MTHVADFEQVRRQVFDSARRLLAGRTEEFPLTHAEIADDTGLEPAVVLQALRSLSPDHLDVSPMDDWARASVRGVTSDTL